MSVIYKFLFPMKPDGTAISAQRKFLVGKF